LTIENCSESLCINCREKSTSCIACSTDSFYEKSAKACYLEADIPEYYGIDLSTPTNDITPCLQGSCNICRVDHSKCSTCKPEGYIHKVSEVCYLDNDIPAGLGKIQDKTPLEVTECHQSVCQSCKEDYTKCTVCGQPTYIESIHSVCYADDTIPDRYGKDASLLPLLSVSPCTDGHCTQCHDNRYCTLCDSGYYLNAESKECVDTVPARYGVDVSSPFSLVRPCEDKHCLECQSNHKICTTCESIMYLFKIDGKCYESGGFPDSYGPSGIDNTLDKCTDPGCLRCDQIIGKCTACINSQEFIAGVCRVKSEGCHIPGCLHCDKPTGKCLRCNTDNHFLDQGDCKEKNVSSAKEILPIPDFTHSINWYSSIRWTEH